MDLPVELAAEIDRLCERGNDLLDEGKLTEAIVEYRAAEALLPEPKTSWEAATWVYAALGDAYYFREDFQGALILFHQAMLPLRGAGNEFLHLRLGQCLFELGQTERAADELGRAYLAGGDEVFEDEDPKYLEFLRTQSDAD